MSPPPMARCRDDFTDQLGPDPAARCVQGTLLALDRGPFGMAAHGVACLAPENGRVKGAELEPGENAHARRKERAERPL